MWILPRKAAWLLQICHIVVTLPASSFWLLQTFHFAAGDPMAWPEMAAGDPMLWPDVAAGDPMLWPEMAAGDPTLWPEMAAGDPTLWPEMAAGDPMLWPDVAQYWPEVASDLTKVTWSHATNSQADLAAALADGTMMIEADVSEGEGGIPIMAHPPADTSDLTLEKFLVDVLAATSDAKTKKGVKLDFKDINIMETSLAMIEKMRITIPFWLNADVLRGPGNSGSPVDADRFLSLCQAHLPQATLSLGWTTTGAPGQYSSEHFADLKNLLDRYQPSAPITLPLRASLAAESREAIVEYLAVNPGTSLTIWSGKEDEVDLTKLVVLIDEVGMDRVYVDVPEDLRERMASASAETSGVAGLGMLASAEAVSL